MRTRRLVKVAGVLCCLTLVMAACGDDDDDGSSDTTEAEQPSEDGGELEGAKGTTPAPETTDAVEEFRTRMDEHAEAAGIDLADTYAYGPEAYDSVMIVALAAQVAKDDGSKHASEIVNVTKGGEKCSTYAD